ncbi:MAG: hypothetical protein D3903_10015 [Candidatus Electrothrix sp. GM3_4]|nr:hypothetical protein [Candidatus Electrothrix sp. GM3_4]
MEKVYQLKKPTQSQKDRSAHRFLAKRVPLSAIFFYSLPVPFSTERNKKPALTAVNKTNLGIVSAPLLCCASKP